MASYLDLENPIPVGLGKVKSAPRDEGPRGSTGAASIGRRARRAPGVGRTRFGCLLAYIGMQEHLPKEKEHG